VRGYLWRSLAEDVLEEFDQYQKSDIISGLERYAMALLAHEIREAKHERKLARAHLELVRNARHDNWWRRLVIANRAASRRDGHTRRQTERRPRVPAAPTRAALAQRAHRERKAQPGNIAGGK
jgi:hypothetical protein